MIVVSYPLASSCHNRRPWHLTPRTKVYGKVFEVVPEYGPGPTVDAALYSTDQVQTAAIEAQATKQRMGCDYLLKNVKNYSEVHELCAPEYKDIPNVAIEVFADRELQEEGLVYDHWLLSTMLTYAFQFN